MREAANPPPRCRPPTEFTAGLDCHTNRINPGQEDDDDDDDDDLTESTAGMESSLGSSSSGAGALLYTEVHLKEVKNQGVESEQQETKMKKSKKEFKPEEEEEQQQQSKQHDLAAVHQAILDFGRECQDMYDEYHFKPRAASSLSDVPLAQRQQARRERQQKALERVRRQQQEEAAAKLQQQSKLQQQQQPTERQRRDRALQEYLQHGFPNKAELLEIVRRKNTIASNNTTIRKNNNNNKSKTSSSKSQNSNRKNHGNDYRVTEADIELLPWMDGDWVVDPAAATLT
mmetsp:Transcript_6727/g.17319  ORF Transcript_6727/g.17319 Transcript_6727/m.17319 type:complete len:287 (-) Transcript_6727:9-869(-)